MREYRKVRYDSGYDHGEDQAHDRDAGLLALQEDRAEVRVRQADPAPCRVNPTRFFGILWISMTIVAAFPWAQHEGWPHSKGAPSPGALAVTTVAWAFTAVVFIVVAVGEKA